MGEVFEKSNFLTTVAFQETSSEEGEGIANTADYLLWFCKERDRFRGFPLFREKQPGDVGARSNTSTRGEKTALVTRKLTPTEIANPELLTDGWVICRRGYPLTSQDFSPTRTVEFVFEGRKYYPGKNRHWSVSPDKGLPSLVQKGRVYSTGDSLSGIMDLRDMPGTEIGNIWLDTGTGSFTDEQIYVLQTSEKVIERCILMTTEPGDLVLDPTCGSGTTAYCAEKWGRRRITVDTSRVPMVLARQRLLSATFPYFRLLDEKRGPASGLMYETKEKTGNRKQDGFGIAMQHALSSIAGDEPATPIVFRNRPEIDYGITRVAGPFCIEATIPTPADWQEGASEKPAAESVGQEAQISFVDRMLEILRKSPVLRLEGNKSVTLKNVRPPAKTLSLSAEAMAPNGAEKPVAIVFGPEKGAVIEKLVYEAAKEGNAKNYSHLYVIGFAIQPNARMLIEKCSKVVGIPATYFQATPDLMMGDLLKNVRSSQIFSVCGLPEIEVRKVKAKDKPGSRQFEVELLGFDVFDPIPLRQRS